MAKSQELFEQPGELVQLVGLLFGQRLLIQQLVAPAKRAWQAWFS